MLPLLITLLAADTAQTLKIPTEKPTMTIKQPKEKNKKLTKIFNIIKRRYESFIKKYGEYEKYLVPSQEIIEVYHVKIDRKTLYGLQLLAQTAIDYINDTTPYAIFDGIHKLLNSSYDTLHERTGSRFLKPFAMLTNSKIHNLYLLTTDTIFTDIMNNPENFRKPTNVCSTIGLTLYTTMMVLFNDTTPKILTLKTEKGDYHFTIEYRDSIYSTTETHYHVHKSKYKKFFKVEYFIPVVPLEEKTW